MRCAKRNESASVCRTCVGPKCANSLPNGGRAYGKSGVKGIDPRPPRTALRGTGNLQKAPEPAHQISALRCSYFSRSELPSRSSKAGLRKCNCTIPPFLLRPDHRFDIEVLNAPKQEREAINPLFHDLH